MNDVDGGKEGVEVVEDLDAMFGGVWKAFATGDRAALEMYQDHQSELDQAEMEQLAFG